MNYIHVSNVLPEEPISQAILVRSCLTWSFSLISSLKTCSQTFLLCFLKLTMQWATLYHPEIFFYSSLQLFISICFQILKSWIRTICCTYVTAHLQVSLSWTLNSRTGAWNIWYSYQKMHTHKHKYIHMHTYVCTKS